MPQASKELQDKMEYYFGDPVSDEHPSKYLIHRGYEQRGDWTWRKPSPDYVPTKMELDCIQFLIEEWDEGGLVTD